MVILGLSSEKGPGKYTRFFGHPRTFGARTRFSGRSTSAPGSSSSRTLPRRARAGSPLGHRARRTPRAPRCAHRARTDRDLLESQAREGVGHEASDIRTERVQPPPWRAGMQREKRRVGYERHGTAATPWWSATTSTMSPTMRLTSKSLGVYARHAGRPGRARAAHHHGPRRPPPRARAARPRSARRASRRGPCVSRTAPGERAFLEPRLAECC